MRGPNVSHVVIWLLLSLLISYSVQAEEAEKATLQELSDDSAKQIFDFTRFRRRIFVTRTCNSDGTCMEIPSKTRPPRTFPHLRCRSRCIGATTCGSGRATGCTTVRDSSGNFQSVCRLRRCFADIIDGRRTQCCSRETCERPRRCRSVPGGSGPPGPPTPITPTDDGDIDLGEVPFTAEFTIRDCISIPNVTQDIYLLTDATGSMASFIAQVRDRFQDIINNRAMMGMSDVAFGAGIYRDERELSGGFSNLQSLSTDPDDTRTAINTINAQGGRDTPEAGLVALYRLATDPTIGWRAEAQKVIVIFGDAPQHEPTCVDGKVITRREVIDALNAADISVVSIDVNRLNAETTSFTCAGTVTGSGLPGNQAIEISEETNGESGMTLVASEITMEINAALDRLKLQFFIDVSDCQRAYNIAFNISNPLEVMRGDTVCFEETIIFRPGICEPEVPNSCKVSFIASGPLLGTQNLETQSVSGCPLVTP